MTDESFASAFNDLLPPEDPMLQAIIAMAALRQNEPARKEITTRLDAYKYLRRSGTAAPSAFKGMDATPDALSAAGKFMAVMDNRQGFEDTRRDLAALINKVQEGAASADDLPSPEDIKVKKAVALSAMVGRNSLDGTMGAMQKDYRQFYGAVKEVAESGDLAAYADHARTILDHANDFVGRYPELVPEGCADRIARMQAAVKAALGLGGPAAGEGQAQAPSEGWVGRTGRAPAEAKPTGTIGEAALRKR